MPSYVEIAAGIARQAGDLLLDYRQRRIGYELKGEADLVTAADRASEELVVGLLHEQLPTHGVIAEEGARRPSAEGYVWYVDPLDGTTNFAHDFPAFCVSIGLALHGELITGVIYDPLRDEMFSAEKGAGAFLNGARIAVSPEKSLANSLLATGFPSYKRHKNINIHFFHQLAMLSHGVRRAGSAALDLAYTACGRLEGFWEFGLKPWDMAAGVALIQEAGGVVSTPTGSRFSLDQTHVLADNGHIHTQVLQLFEEILRGDYRIPIPGVEEGSGAPVFTP